MMPLNQNHTGWVILLESHHISKFNITKYEDSSVKFVKTIVEMP